MDYVDFMRKVDGKPPKPEADTSGFWYTEDFPPTLGTIRAVLAGNLQQCSSAFTWAETPQKHSYWSRINSGCAQLTAWDIQYLEWMLEEYS
jgi:hypothetical protein